MCEVGFSRFDSYLMRLIQKTIVNLCFWVRLPSYPRKIKPSMIIIMNYGLNFLSKCACAAFNWVHQSVARSRVPQVHFIRKQTMCKSLYRYLTICFPFEKPRWLLHNTADRAETVFSHLNQSNLLTYKMKFTNAI